MPMIIKDSGGKDFEPAPQGMHAAVCTQIVDMGEQETVHGLKRRVRIQWEIDEKMENGQPFTPSAMYTISLNKKSTLRGVLESWRGRAFSEEELNGFDLEKLLGKGCYLNIVHDTKDDKTYANVKTVVPLPKGMPAPTPSGDLLLYSCDAPNRAVLEKLPEWLGDKVTTGQGRLQAKAAMSQPQRELAPADIDDEIPF